MQKLPFPWRARGYGEFSDAANTSQTYPSAETLYEASAVAPPSTAGSGVSVAPVPQLVTQHPFPAPRDQSPQGQGDSPSPQSREAGLSGSQSPPSPQHSRRPRAASSVFVQQQQTSSHQQLRKLSQDLGSGQAFGATAAGASTTNGPHQGSINQDSDPFAGFQDQWTVANGTTTNPRPATTTGVANFDLNSLDLFNPPVQQARVESTSLWGNGGFDSEGIFATAPHNLTPPAPTPAVVSVVALAAAPSPTIIRGRTAGSAAGSCVATPPISSRSTPGRQSVPSLEPIKALVPPSAAARRSIVGCQVPAGATEAVGTAGLQQQGSPLGRRPSNTTNACLDDSQSGQELFDPVDPDGASLASRNHRLQETSGAYWQHSDHLQDDKNNHFDVHDQQQQGQSRRLSTTTGAVVSTVGSAAGSVAGTVGDAVGGAVTGIASLASSQTATRVEQWDPFNKNKYGELKSHPKQHLDVAVPESVSTDAWAGVEPVWQDAADASAPTITSPVSQPSQPGQQPHHSPGQASAPIGQTAHGDLFHQANQTPAPPSPPVDEHGRRPRASFLDRVRRATTPSAKSVSPTAETATTSEPLPEPEAKADKLQEYMAGSAPRYPTHRLVLDPVTKLPIGGAAEPIISNDQVDDVFIFQTMDQSDASGKVFVDKTRLNSLAPGNDFASRFNANLESNHHDSGH